MYTFLGLQVDFRKFSIWAQDDEIWFITIFRRQEHEYGNNESTQILILVFLTSQKHDIPILKARGHI